jgi:HlyD family secretion protein/macrolide-specific efflux system membrane fusion protein
MFVQRFRVIVLLCLLATTATACGGGNRVQATPTPLPRIQQYQPTIYTVELGPIEADTIINGNIVPSRQDELFFRTSGYVTRVLVKEGEYVKAGQLLAEMQVDDLLNQLEQADIDLQVAQTNLAKAELARKYAVDRAALDVSINEARVALAELELEGSLTTEAKERAEINLSIQQAYLELSRIALQEARDNADATYESQSVDRSQLTVTRLQGYLAERQIYAPYDGVILKNRVREGNSADAFQNMITIGDPTETVIRSPMDNELRNVLSKDSEITMKLSAEAVDEYVVQYLPNFIPLSDTKEEKSSVVAEYLYFSVPAELQGNDELLSRPARLRVILGREAEALLLPPAAIRNYRGLDFVIVIDGEERRRVEIYEIGLKTPDRWQVIADLKEGDQVLGP